MRVLNKKYWPYSTQTRFLDGDNEKAISWCEKNLPGKHRWVLAGPGVWYFRSDRDRTMFVLRWSS